MQALTQSPGGPVQPLNISDGNVDNSSDCIGKVDVINRAFELMNRRQSIPSVIHFSAQ